MALDLEIRGGIILSSHNNYTPFVGSIGISEDQITEVSEKSFGLTNERLINAQGKIVMPGLINGHCHGDMTVLRGLGDNKTLLEQNLEFGRTSWFKEQLSDKDRYYSRQLTYCEALLSGTTFIMENMFWWLEDSVNCMTKTGIRGALANDIRYDFSNPTKLLPLDELLSFKKSCENNGIIPLIGSISEEDFDTKLYQQIEELKDLSGLSSTAHIAETLWRLNIIEKKYAMRSVEYLQSIGALSDKLIASHVVHVDESEIEKLSAARVKVVNTPLCEMKIADGAAPLSQLIDAGVTVGLGTDGAMWNNTNDIFREMKAAVLLQSLISGTKSITAKQALDMGTINGAKVFGLEKNLGTIETGKKADIILVDVTQPHMRPLRLERNENASSNIVYGATGRDVTDVFVGGRQLVKNREMTEFDLEGLLLEIDEVSRKLERSL